MPGEVRKRQAGVWEEGATLAEAEGELETPLVMVEKQTEATELGEAGVMHSG